MRQRLGARIVEGPVDDDRAAALQHVGAHQSERAAAKPLGGAGNGPDQVLGRLAPARLIRQMPKPDENLGQEADARRARAVMRLARTRARHVGGVLGGKVDPAGSIAEEVQGLGREASGSVKIPRLSGGLEQGERGAGHRRVIVDEGAGAGMSLPPGVQKPTVAAPELAHDKIERGARGCNPGRLAEHGAGADERRDGQAVPVGQHLVVAAGLGARLAHGEQFCPRGGELGLLVGRTTRTDAAQHRPAFPVSPARDVIGGLEAGRGVAERGVDLVLPPDIEEAFLAVLIGVEGSGEGVADAHLAHQPADRLTGASGECRIGPQRVDQRQQFKDLRVVVEHLLEVRHEPFGVGRVARIAAGEMIVDAAGVHRLEHGAQSFAEGRVAAAKHLVPEKAEDRRIGEFRRSREAAMNGIDRAQQRIADPGQIGGRHARPGA